MRFGTALKLAYTSVAVRRPHWDDRPECLVGLEPTLVWGDGGYAIDLNEIGWGYYNLSYEDMDADDWDCDAGLACGGVGGDSSTSADALNVGVFYTFPAGTELHVAYGEVSNDRNATYDFGISGAGVVTGGDAEHIALGIVQWF